MISDIHLGYHSGNKTNRAGVNVREDDFINAARKGVRNLLEANVDVIIDCGDMAEVPAPKKRAIQTLLNLIQGAEIPFLSADGNHTSLKSSSDIHLYDILMGECVNFYGFKGPGFDTYSGVAFAPHRYDPNEQVEVIEEALELSNGKATMLVGHFAAEDSPFRSPIPLSALPTSIPVFLGHWHRHRESKNHHPTYVGSTERTAWDQWDYPTGVSVYDSDTGLFEYIPHETREFVNLESTVDGALDLLASTEVEDRIVRLTVSATPEEYQTLDRNALTKLAQERNALQYHHRRAKTKNSEQQEAAPGDAVGTLADQWDQYVKTADLKSNVSRSRIAKMGRELLTDESGNRSAARRDNEQG